MAASPDSTRVVLARRRPSQLEPDEKSESSDSSEQDDLEGAADLSALLCSEIQNTLPSLLDRLRSQLDAFTAERKAIGEPKKTHAERLSWLLGVTRQYEHRVTHSLSYSGEAGPGAIALRGEVFEMNSRFDRFMRLYGGYYQFEYDGADPHALLAESVLWWQSRYQEWSNSDPARPATPASQAPFEAHRQPTPRAPEMEFDGHITVLAPCHDLTHEISCQVRRFSTLVPGIIHPQILENLYRLQTQKWLAVSMNLLESVSIRVEEAAKYILDTVCPPSGSTTALRRAFKDRISTMHEKATTEVRQVLEDFVSSVRENFMQTTDPAFREEVQMWAYVRSFKSMEDSECGAENPLKSCHAFLNMMARSAHKDVESEIHDVTRVYYARTLDYFIRHITGTIVEKYVCSANGALKGLSSEYIMKLKKDDVESLAREDPSTIERRKILDEEISRRKRALKIAQRARNRTEGVWI